MYIFYFRPKKNRDGEEKDQTTIEKMLNCLGEDTGRGDSKSYWQCQTSAGKGY